MNTHWFSRSITYLFSEEFAIPVKLSSPALIIVDSDWDRHTANSWAFWAHSGFLLKYLKWHFQQYSLFCERMDLWGDHSNQVFLHYESGSGNDLTGFLIYSDAKKVIRIDVSERILALASQRLSLHN